jgi:hypothetical protein
VASIARSRASGLDPTNSPEARAKRSITLATRKAEQLAWDADDHPTETSFGEDILAGLARVPLSEIQAATGLSISAASRIRSGKLTPHARHWETLSAISRSTGGRPSATGHDDDGDDQVRTATAPTL